jgi:membrane fusion protein, multidrug efflux system
MWHRRVFMTLAAGLLGACASDPPPPPPPPPITVADVVEREINEWDEFTGRIEAVDAVEIRPRVSGISSGSPLPRERK